jgi:hypothetical protein
MDKDTTKITFNKVPEKLHQRILVHEGTTYPDGSILTTARKADKNDMEELVVLAEDGWHDLTGDRWIAANRTSIQTKHREIRAI